MYEITIPTNTTDRLRAVAAAVERHPEKWDQGDFINHDKNHTEEVMPWKPVGVVGSGVPTCGTTLCVAGWGVVLSPNDGKITDEMGGEEAGAAALGFDIDLAAHIFYQVGNDEYQAEQIRLDMPTVLRRLAEIPEDKRILSNPAVEEILAIFEDDYVG